MNVFDAMYQSGVVPVIIVNDPKKAVDAARAMYRGGSHVVELAMRVEGVAECIRAVRREVPEMVVGAGTVLRLGQLEEAAQAGAMFGVAPGYDDEIVARSQELGLPFIPGTSHSSDVQKAIKAGLKVIKFFPSEPLGGLNHLEHLAGPYPMIRFLPSGGVNFDNLEAYLDFRPNLCCATGFTCTDEHLAAEDWETVTALCSRTTAIARKRLDRGESHGLIF